MPRRRGARPLPRTDRDLAEEILYLHSLWRRGPPARAPSPVQLPASTPTPSRSTRCAGSKLKRRRPERGAAAEPQDTGSEWHLAPSPPASPKPWPDASTSSSSPAKKPPPAAPPSPGSFAQREALRAAAQFFPGRGSDDEGSESEGEEGEEEAAGFFTGLFERDAALRGHYERGWEEGQFACMACAGRTARRGKARRFRGCVGLVQHARAAKRYGRPGAHRALAAVVCRVLGWDIERLPSIVMDPRGTLGQALAADATADAQEAKEDAEARMEGSSTDCDEEVNAQVAKENDDTGENNSASSDDQEDVEIGMEGSSTDDDDEEAKEPEISKETVEMEGVEDICPMNCEDDSKNEVLGYEAVQEVNANMDDSLRPDNNGEVHEQDISKECAEKENTNKTNMQSSKDSCENEEHFKETAIKEEVHVTESESELAKTTDDTGDTVDIGLGNNSSTEVNATERENELAKTADDTVDAGVTRLGNNSSMEENIGENKDEYCDSTS